MYLLSASWEYAEKSGGTFIQEGQQSRGAAWHVSMSAVQSDECCKENCALYGESVEEGKKTSPGYVWGEFFEGRMSELKWMRKWYK